MKYVLSSIVFLPLKLLLGTKVAEVGVELKMTFEHTKGVESEVACVCIYVMDLIYACSSSCKFIM